MVLLKVIGKLWATCPVPTSPKIRCPTTSGYILHSTLHRWLTWSQASSKVNLHLPSCSFAAPKPTAACGPLSLQYATFTTWRVARLSGYRIKPTLWMALPLVILLHPMFSSCTTPAKICYGPDAYKIDPQRIPGSIFLSIKYYGCILFSLHCNRAPSQEKPYTPGTGGIKKIPPLTNPVQVQLWTSPSTLPSHLRSICTLFNFDDSTTTTVSVAVSDLHSILPKPQVKLDDADGQHSLLPASCNWKRKSLISTMGSTTKVFLENTMVSIGLSTCTIPISNTKNGGSYFWTYHILVLNSVSNESCSQATILPLSFVKKTHQLLTLLQMLLVSPIYMKDILHPSSRLLLTPTPIVRSGSKVTKKRKNP